MTIFFVLIYISLFVGAYVGVQLNKQEEQFVVRYDFNRFEMRGMYDVPNFVAIANSRWEEISLENRQREAAMMEADEMESPWESYIEGEDRQDAEYDESPFCYPVYEEEISTFEESPIGGIYDFNSVEVEVEVEITLDVALIGGKEEEWVSWGKKVESINFINPARSANNNKGYSKKPRLFERWG